MWCTAEDRIKNGKKNWHISTINEIWLWECTEWKLINLFAQPDVTFHWVSWKWTEYKCYKVYLLVCIDQSIPKWSKLCLLISLLSPYWMYKLTGESARVSIIWDRTEHCIAVCSYHSVWIHCFDLKTLQSEVTVSVWFSSEDTIHNWQVKERKWETYRT